MIYALQYVIYDVIYAFQWENMHHWSNYGP